MISNKLSRRRGTAPAPPICRSKKPFPVVPPPVGAYPWPPIIAECDAVLTGLEEGDLEHHADFAATEVDPLTFEGEHEHEYPNCWIRFEFSEPTEELYVELEIQYDDTYRTYSIKGGIPLNWGNHETLNITEWDEIDEDATHDLTVYI